MNIKLRVLLIEDYQYDADLIILNLKCGGYDVYYERVYTAAAVNEALIKSPWDIVISDYAMPSFDGLEALSILKQAQLDIPFILVSGVMGEEVAVEAMRNGAQDYIMKDNLSRLVPAVKRELCEADRRRADKKTQLKLREAEEKLFRFRKFFSPQVADLIVSAQLEDPFKWRRKEITVLFIDLRGFTRFVEISEPEDVMALLQEYYAVVANVVQTFNGTIGHIAGDGIMVIFNDPIEIPNPEQCTVKMALEIRASLTKICTRWKQQAVPLCFGVAVASGPATIGGIGIQGCWDYSVIGTVTNLAGRLCSEAKNGQILVSRRLLSTIQSSFLAEPVGELSLKGLKHPVSTYNIVKEI